jgi:tripartite-type tricarboxylate transporter receptor subunit TctC
MFITKLLKGMAIASIAAIMPLTASAEWVPKKPIDFIIMAGKGGGADKMARLMQSVIQKKNMSPMPLIPINKSGGTGAEALVHLKQKTGDDHSIMVTLNSFYTTPMRQAGLGIDVMTFTPVGRMAEDTFLLWVKSDSGISNVDEFVAAVKATKDGEWLMGGTGSGSEDNILTDYLNEAYGLKIKYIPYKGGGDVAKALAGGHIQSTVNNPSEQDGFYKAGTTRPLAAFTDERLAMYPEAPTFKELGKNFSYFMQRSVVGAPGMSDDAAAYYQKLFADVYKTAEWQKYRTKKSLQGEFLTGDGLKSYWSHAIEVHKDLLNK